MTEQVIRLQRTITQFEMMGCWGLAESFRKILIQLLKEQDECQKAS